MGCRSDLGALAVGGELQHPPQFSVCYPAGFPLAVKGSDLKAVLPLCIGYPDAFSRAAQRDRLPDPDPGQATQVPGRTGAVRQEPGLSPPLHQGAVTTMIGNHRFQPVQGLDGDRPRLAKRDVHRDGPWNIIQGIEDVEDAACVEDHPPAIRGGVPAIALGEGVFSVGPQVAAVWGDAPDLCLLTRFYRQPRTQIRGEDDPLSHPARTGQAGTLLWEQPLPLFLILIGDPDPVGHTAAVAFPGLRAAKIRGGQHHPAIWTPVCGRGWPPFKPFQFTVQGNGIQPGKRT